MKISDLVIIKLIHLINENGWTAKYTALQLGFSQTYVTNIINKRENPSKKFLANAFILLVTYERLIKTSNKIKELR